MRIELKTGPIVNPAVTLADVKTYAFKNTSSYDGKITSLLIPEQQYLEEYIGRKLIDQSWYIYLDALEYSDRLQAYNKSITLSTFNVSSIVEVTKYDQFNTGTVETASNYRLSGNQLSDVSMLVYNDTYSPTMNNLRTVDAVRIEVIAGYGLLAADVPGTIIQALSVQIDQKVRFGNKITESSTESFNENYQNLLMPYRSVENWY
jgi:uncharacterized phiE125 gp8 family phage protein